MRKEREKNPPAAGHGALVAGGNALPLVRVNCARCGSFESALVVRAGDFERAGQGEFEVARCLRCGFTYTSVRPESRTLFKVFYPDDYLCYGAGKEGFFASWIDGFRTEGQMRQRLAFCRKYVSLRAGMRLLEVGCATGKFLAKCGEQLGFDVTGVEPNARLAGILRERGIRVVNSIFEKADLPRDHYDIACLFHVLEHVWDSISTLKRLNRVLKSGGHLLLELPNHETPGKRIFGKYWFNYHLPRHISHFDERTLGDALRDAGFELVAVRYEFRPTINALSLQYMAEDHLKAPLLRKLFSANSPQMLILGVALELFVSIMGRRATMTVLARKKRDVHDCASLVQERPV
jgi:SAM-dependent methyltransferase